MLWSLIKVMIFIALVAALTYGAGWLMQTEGGIQVTVAGTEYTLGPLQSVIAAVVIVVGVWLLLKLAGFLVATIRFINGDETAISRYFDRNRERKGYKALSEGMMALASGEGQLAMTKAAKAERFLNRSDLTDLMTAQAAEMVGDRKKAEEVYKRLVQDDKTRFVGVRGIMKQRLSEGDTETARQLAEKAIALRPRHEETQDTLLRLQAQANDWAGARKTLATKLKTGTLPRDVHKRRDAVLALSEAKGVLDEGKSIEAQEAAIAANKASPDLIPAACMAARSYIAKGNKRHATRILTKAWQVHPHPDLAAAFAEIEPDETPEARLKRFVALTKHYPESAETRLVKAELHIAAEDFPGARRALGDLPDKAPDARALTLMAAIERGEGASDTVVKGWLARALTAPRGPAWVCDNCHNIQGEWTPVCTNCQSFDTLSWKTPPHADMANATGVAMLPLIVGALEDKGAAAPAPVAPRPTTPPSEPEVMDAEIVETDDAPVTVATSDEPAGESAKT
ncbi:heme biosynthesis protein HemY [Mesobacterium pallidum]|uniref:heme biosynthesis protein HemY n=1 Tax=Mesobacterium pallidum TaxID=2872037 RepID=UPI001EE3711D|nr:heme biosynthesis HemY N-terminal domain-containing protein [Mesobacterium pallidum]